MLIGYVSDEYNSALADAVLDIECDGKLLAAVRSTATGSVHADLSAGQYRMTISRTGFGSKRVCIDVTPTMQPYQFRLLSDNLIGYAWPKWTRGGGRSEFRVHSVEGYQLSLWRYGQTKELVRMIGWYDEHAPRAVMQITPDGDFTQSGVDWNRHGYPANFTAQQVIAPEKSGLYYFHAETESGEFFSFPWVVAPARPQARIAVLASTNTWNAYNNFGGRSNYVNTNGLPPRPTVNARQDLGRYSAAPGGVWQYRNEDYPPLSFDRPEPFNHIPRETQATDPIRGRQACHLVPAEWRLLAWLEREGFAYDFYSDAQLHHGELDLDAYEVLIISTHPEYWTQMQYKRVKEWVYERGGKLMYLGGNGIDCEVDYPTPDTMHCNTWLPGPDRALVFTHPEDGRHYDCRFHYTVESPAQLLGVVFTEPGIGTGAPYRVVDAEHPLFAGTGLKNGDTFGANSLHERSPGGASGHETDKRSASTPANAKILAQGLNPGSGGAEMVTYETESGGAVFSVGSITWPACLLSDVQISHITRNVLEGMLSAQTQNNGKALASQG